MPKNHKKQVLVYTGLPQTPPSRVDPDHTTQLVRLFRGKLLDKNVEVLCISDLSKKTGLKIVTNEDVRTAVYSYNLHNPLCMLLRLSVPAQTDYSLVRTNSAAVSDRLVALLKQKKYEISSSAFHTVVELQQSFDVAVKDAIFRKKCASLGFNIKNINEFEMLYNGVADFLDARLKKSKFKNMAPVARVTKGINDLISSTQTPQAVRRMVINEKEAIAEMYASNGFDQLSDAIRALSSLFHTAIAMHGKTVGIPLPKLLMRELELYIDNSAADPDIKGLLAAERKEIERIACLVDASSIYTVFSVPSKQSNDGILVSPIPSFDIQIKLNGQPSYPSTKAYVTGTAMAIAYWVKSSK